MDLKKAYDSVPRSALWCVIEKLGVPPTMISIIKSFHEGMSAKVVIGQEFTESIDVCNGLCQGCTMAPVLFSLYFSAVIDDWRGKCSTSGVEFRYKHGRKLIGDKTAESRLLLDFITESQFAVDASLYATSEEDFVTMAQSFVGIANSWGLTVSLTKTKIGNVSSFEGGIPVYDESVEMVEEL